MGGLAGERGLVLLGGGLGGFCAGGFRFGGAEEDGQVIERFEVIFKPPADVAYPGGKIRNGDQVFAEPGEISDLRLVHLAYVALAAWNHAGWVVKTPQLVRRFPGGITHLNLNPLYHRNIDVKKSEKLGWGYRLRK